MKLHPKTVQMPENLQTVREAFEPSPRHSKCQPSRILGVSNRSLHRMIKEIKFHPYKLQVVQQINERDKEAGLAFCTSMSGLLQKNPDFMNNLLMTEETDFHVSG